MSFFFFIKFIIYWNAEGIRCHLGQSGQFYFVYELT